MVKLRLKRMGSKFNAFYRIVAADSRAPRDGRFIEEIGYYNPHTKEVFVNDDLKSKWESQGAKPSDTVKNLFKKVEIAKSKGNIKNNVVTLEVKIKKTVKLALKIKKVEETNNIEKEKKSKEKIISLKSTSKEVPIKKTITKESSTKKVDEEK